MYLIKHKSISVFLNDDQKWKSWSQCHNPVLLHTENEIESFIKMNKVLDAIPYLVMIKEGGQRELYFVRLKGEHGILNALPSDMVAVYPMTHVSNPLAEPEMVKRESLIDNF